MTASASAIEGPGGGPYGSDSKGLDNFTAFLSSEVLRVVTKVGRMYPPGMRKAGRGISALLISGLTPWGHQALRLTWAYESLGIDHFDYALFKFVWNFFPCSSQDRMEAPGGEIPS